MTVLPARAPLEDVLMAFSVEADPRRERLERYLKKHPDYALELIDLSQELGRGPCDEDRPLSADDTALIDAAWQAYREVDPAPVDPFANLSARDLRDLASWLDVPGQVVMAIREGSVAWATVPRRFVRRLAERLGSTGQALEAYWTSAAHPIARSYKANVKPRQSDAVSFERVLEDAGVPENKRAELMSDAD